MLKFSPTQIQQYRKKGIPKGLIYKQRDNVSHILLDTKTGNIVGEMSLILRPCDNLPFYETKPNTSTLHIYSLKIFEQLKGWGSYLIDFAKRESYKRGCEGRCSLVAHHSGRSPHTFYKKHGFITTDLAYNEYLDECIAKKQKLYYERPKNMFIPIPEFMPKPPFQETIIEEKTGFFQKIKNKIREFMDEFFINFVKNNYGDEF